MKGDLVYAQAIQDHREVGNITMSLPNGFKASKRYYDAFGEHITIFNFGIYWHDQPDVLCVITYGPKDNHRHNYQPGYCCYAS